MWRIAWNHRQSELCVVFLERHWNHQHEHRETGDPAEDGCDRPDLELLVAGVLQDETTDQADHKSCSETPNERAPKNQPRYRDDALPCGLEFRRHGHFRWHCPNGRLTCLDGRVRVRVARTLRRRGGG